MSLVLVTGGAGYIGTHTCVELMAAGHDVVVVDNFCNSKPEALRRVTELAGRGLAGHYRADVRDKAALGEIFDRHEVDAVIHFAALKAVGESVRLPLSYYDNNIAGTVALAEVMGERGVKSLVFSSSATVYGDPASMPIRESFPTSPTNPYGRTKWMMEYILQDVAAADPEWRVALLRYFNPVGAHSSGRIGEDPNGTPNNLMPFVSQVAIGRLARLQVFGDDYETPDGTGVRDYIHVVDLAQGHVCAVERLLERKGVLTLNLGTGRGYSVIEMVKAFERASGRSVPYSIAPRRPGDIAQCWADPALAEQELGWVATRGIDAMCVDTWRWQSANPQGYPDD
ncbi:MAG: UDP-glucose 4-epimerase GalE [Rhodocyclaceae bacterium]|nr:UDP-glucose 4-epimerase GalE [Rhodocyclaceae bacterium]MCP5240089.1 UDP-glucose 4-epimerase GalE [Zoogloeaceae bacterium]MCB1910711.1 UDP-glucose 4-epimerase GalE [Rhodocyclaceae bacterium]MCP5253682.1 UDP-glucose 4-epimerase GalE [Zoogloeaceae bacterium]MCP5293928.1 UDP-glucose 4-epimerase GalE [Zoogloeaceae bacterium]